MPNSLMNLENSKSPISEAYRTLRTNIQFVSANSGVKKIMITSACPEEGKSFVVSNLAVCMAQSGKSVLVVDADLRKPTQHKLFEVENGEGLSVALMEVVAQKPDFKGYIRETAVPGVRVITAGPIPPNPAELLSSKSLKYLIGVLSEQFDVILFDTPPILAVTDAAILAQEVDGVVLVLTSSKVTKEQAKRAKELLDQVGAKILGAVLNKVKIKANEYYYDYH
ncbi:CpsD/CapB family tyrosine-protein kinase [Desulfitobacterium sp. THU1]|uniref:CpsD/CapB family tyrosine-protein kinase n=1 Tax=Desulfitobacterium sp. THU1 TaxID=3138072 RepID=UPI00311E6FAE